MNGFDLSTISDLYVGDTPCSAIYIGDTLLWPLTPKDYSKEYLTFEAVENTTFSFTTNDLEYSIDGGTTWTTLTAGSSTPTINTGNNIMWKCSSPTIPNIYGTGIGSFSSQGQYNIYGNILSLLYGDNFKLYTTLPSKQYIFCNMFSNCHVVDASNLILLATTAKSGCYNLMFGACTDLISAPELPATTLETSCYAYMFYNCSSLVNVPTILPATTLVDYCYQHMFQGCTSLTTAPELPDFEFSSAGAGGVSILEQMFYGCESLNYIKCLSTHFNSATMSLNFGQWVQGVAATGTFVKAPSVSWPSGVNGIPTGWTVNDIVLPKYAVTISDVDNALEGEGPTIDSSGYYAGDTVYLEWNDYNYNEYDPAVNREYMFDITVTPSNLNYEFVYGYDNGEGDAQSAYLEFTMPSSNVSFTFAVVPNPDYDEGGGDEGGGDEPTGDYYIEIMGAEYLDPETIPDYANEGDYVYLYAGDGYCFADSGYEGTGTPLILDLDGDMYAFTYESETTCYFTMPGNDVSLMITEKPAYTISYSDSSYLDGNEPYEAYEGDTVTAYVGNGYYFGDESSDISNGLIISASGTYEVGVDNYTLDDLTADGSTLNFSMPAGNVMIEFTLLTHDITYTGSEYLDGTESQQANQSQQVTITCAEGYYFADSGQTGEGTPLYITIIDGDGYSVTPDMVYDTWFQFTMPYSDADVTISE